MRLKSLLLLSVLVTGTITLVQAVPPTRPTGVVAYAPNQNRVHLSWFDAATDETSYLVDLWVPDPENPGDPQAGSWVRQGSPLPANSEVYRREVPSSAEQTFRFRVAPFKAGEIEANLNWEEADVTKPSGSFDLVNRIFGAAGYQEVPEGSEAVEDANFNFQLEVYNGTPTRFVSRGMPTGATLTESTGVVSGVMPEQGVFRFIYGVEFGDGKLFEQVRYIRVLPKPSTPVVSNPTFSVPTQNAGVAGFLYLDRSNENLFSDPGRPKGIWFDTSLGSFIVALYDKATPKTVNNILDYVTTNSYNGSYLHRAVSGFVIQGGGARPASANASPTQWVNIPKFRVVPNEPGVSNRRGTMAMAKSGSADSATSEWFASVGLNNPAILDRQASGFTAFGEVVGDDGMAVVDALSQRPTGNYSSLITGTSGTSLSEVPVLDAAAPATPGPNSLVGIFSVREVSPISITVAANSNPAVIQATVVGQALFVESPGAIGTAQLTLRATNLDGNSVDFVLPITIDDSTVPSVGLTKLRGAKPLGFLMLRGMASDNGFLDEWRYRINRGKWQNGGKLSGKSALLKKKMGPFRSGKNVIEIEVYDKKGNSSDILKQTFTLG